MSITYTLLASVFVSILLFCFPTWTQSAKCNSQDKKVLKEIEKAIAIPPYFQSWTTDSGCCEWYGVRCDEITNRVISLNIDDGTVVAGKIPDAVGDLPYLKTLIFHKCPNLKGPIPESITKLKNLTTLWFTNNNLSGPIPSFLSKLKNLDYINLSFNNFSGPIPASLSELPKLGYLRLDRNQLTGSIPESLGNLALQSYIIIGHNQLSGKVPQSFANADFTTLDFSKNKLEGDISFLFGKKKTLQTADFSRNLFQFDLSKVEFSNNLIFMDLNHNKIFGSLPEGLTKLELQTFNVSYNRLCGKIPTGGRLQTYEQSAYLHNRCLCGAPLPACK
ncbi:hypothetical protein Leryth_015354 [Lithospermum erythrorhizon]|nr:hypothetical protein Leryth_015354 [Lithospermum erythrorhizon]